MNTTEKNILAQEISLFLFAKYPQNEVLQKMNSYQVTLPTNKPLKRAQLTAILATLDTTTLRQIQKTEQVRPSISTLAPSIPTNTPAITTPQTPKRIFISHSKKDLVYVQELIHILEVIGIQSESIFCSSYEGYGNPLGSNYLDQLKEELQGNTLVLFLLSKNFFDSRTCLCEMGAVWILSQEQIPIYIPPFKGEDVQGVFPNVQGITLNKKEQLILLRQRLEKDFTIQKRTSMLRWERQIDRSLQTLNNQSQ